jgi:hypothetical protein
MGHLLVSHRLYLPRLLRRQENLLRSLSTLARAQEE